MGIASKVTELPISAVKNSKLGKLVQKGVLGKGKPVYATTPKGTIVNIRMNDDGKLIKKVTLLKQNLMKMVHV